MFNHWRLILRLFPYMRPYKGLAAALVVLTALGAVFAVGWVFGAAYRRALAQGGFSMALYALMTALSIYFVMQGLVAFAFRVLLLGAVLWLGWRYAIGFGLAWPNQIGPSRLPALRVAAGAAGADRSA